MNLDEEWDSLNSRFERYGFNLVQNYSTLYLDFEGVRERISGMAKTDDLTLEVRINKMGKTMYMQFTPKETLNGFVLYPEDLPRPTKLDVYYDFNYLDKSAQQGLLEVGRRIIEFREIKGGELNHSQHKNFYPPQKGKDIFIELEYKLQSPSDDHSKCVAGVDPGNIDISMLPYHRLQENHYCMIDDGSGFPLINLRFDPNEINLYLNMLFGSMNEKRIKELLAGLPLPLETTILFIEPNIQYKPFIPDNRGGMIYHDGRQNLFEFIYVGNNFEYGISSIFPHFMRFVEGFKKFENGQYSGYWNK